MNIVRLAQRVPPAPGGLELHVRELTMTQAARGAAVDLVYAEGQVPRAPAITPHQLTSHASGLLRWGPSQHRFAWKASRYRGIKKKVDVIHAHGDYPAAYAGLGLARRCDCPAVLTVHGGLSERWIHRTLSRCVFPVLSHMIAVSDDIADQLVQRGVRRDRISVLSSGIHLARFVEMTSSERASVRETLGVPSDALLVAAVGRLHPVKGSQFLLDAFAELSDSHPDLHLIIAGDGPEAGRLRQIAAGCPTVHLVGALPAERVAQLLRAADLFVLPSIDLGGQREGTPTSLMEAMAAGLPIVATDTGGIPQLVVNGINGLIVPPRNPTALADAMHCLLRDPAWRRRMAVYNREAVRNRDWSVIERQVAEVYARAASIGSQPARPLALQLQSTVAHIYHGLLRKAR
jgi:glycosyltransferase involved in cell wall biosynthesis